jgi:hypothetical protein
MPRNAMGKLMVSRLVTVKDRALKVVGCLAAKVVVQKWATLECACHEYIESN